MKADQRLLHALRETSSVADQAKASQTSKEPQHAKGKHEFVDEWAFVIDILDEKKLCFVKDYQKRDQ